MSWIRLDDGFADRPELIEAGALALALAVWAISYSARHLTDGRIAFGALNGCPWVSKRSALVRACERLEVAGFWTRSATGFDIFDPFQYLQTAETVLRKRAEAAERQRRWRENKRSGRRVTHRVTTDRRNALPDPDPEGVRGSDAAQGVVASPCAECGTGAGLHAVDCSKAIGTA
jgi:hypothetical protein